MDISTQKHTEPCEPSWVCIDCIMMLANGESPVEMDIEDEQDWWERYVGITENADITIGMGRQYHNCLQDGATAADMGGECECETIKDFSSGICATCGSTLAGSRHAVTFWDKES